MARRLRLFEMQGAAPEVVVRHHVPTTLQALELVLDG